MQSEKNYKLAKLIILVCL